MKTTVIEVECSRCHRKEYVPQVFQSIPEGVTTVIQSPPPPAVEIKMNGKTIAKFDDLCEPCLKAVTGYSEQMTKPMEKKSPNRKKKDTSATETTEAAPAPTNGTGAKKEGAHQHPPPAVVTRPR